MLPLPATGLGFALSDVSLYQALLIVVTAFIASIVGGMAGYGTGLLLPLVLVPIIGAEATVPVIGVSAMFTNAGRALAMRRLIVWRTVALMVPMALPMVALSAWLFTGLDNCGATILIGVVLIVLVPLRHLMKHVGFKLSGLPLAASGGVYGFVTGSSTGAGVILVSFLMASGLTGASVIATDAAISIMIGLAKTSTFASLGALPGALFVFAILVGLATMPGAFVAKALLDRMPVKLHTALLDGVVVAGGVAMILQALAR
jgi:uncharacterized membrane protein YfcA